MSSYWPFSDSVSKITQPNVRAWGMRSYDRFNRLSQTNNLRSHRHRRFIVDEIVWPILFSRRKITNSRNTIFDKDRDTDRYMYVTRNNWQQWEFNVTGFKSIFKTKEMINQLYVSKIKKKTAAPFTIRCWCCRDDVLRFRLVRYKLKFTDRYYESSHYKKIFALYSEACKIILILFALKKRELSSTVEIENKRNARSVVTL